MRHISCLFLCLFPSQSLIRWTSTSATVYPLELKCSATGKPGAFLLMLTAMSNAMLRNHLKDIRAHCYCASLVRKLFIRQARATSCISSARTESKINKNIELMTFGLTWCANIFVGCSVTPTFFSRSHPFPILSIILKNRKSVRGKF